MNDTTIEVPKQYEALRIYNEDTIFETAVSGRPYRPKRSSILFVLQGRIRMKEQIHEMEIVSYSFLLINTKYVYEIIEIEPHTEFRLMGYDRDFIEHSTFQLNKVKVYKDLKNQLKRIFTVSAPEFAVFWENIKLLDHYTQHFQTTTYAEQIIQSYFNILLYHLVGIVAPLHEEQLSQLNRQQKLTYNFVNLVSDHYLQEKSVQFYADALSISIRYLSAVVKEIAQRTPNQIISEFIVNEAKAQLNDSSISLKEIATKLHFSDQYAFTHFFKKHLEMSPTQYRSLVNKAK
ncbi:helix-turn-helix domain-containing protein [Myroides fluvii]|uniref:helix-turn-helix domain-containing protein n=1 Tax=Myroides fluvii TaxID=2572594 RepID=UPI00131CDAF8|nr:helix-turn-helix domain-containing protein [Myroides fluvii]